MSRNFDLLRCLNALQAQTRSECACERTAAGTKVKKKQLKNKEEVYGKTEQARRVELKPIAESRRQIELKRQANTG